MKLKGKTFFLMIACISLGVWMSKFMFKQYDTKAVSKFNTIYLLEIGNYNSNKEMEKALTNVDTLNKYDLLLEKATEDTTIDKLEKELIQKYKDACDG